MPPEKPQMERRSEDTDKNGNPRRQHEMKDGTFFFGSEEEYRAELESRRDEAKA